MANYPQREHPSIHPDILKNWSGLLNEMRKNINTYIHYTKNSGETRLGILTSIHGDENNLPKVKFTVDLEYQNGEDTFGFEDIKNVGWPKTDSDAWYVWTQRF